LCQKYPIKPTKKTGMPPSNQPALGFFLLLKTLMILRKSGKQVDKQNFVGIAPPFMF
jgi:hypothetical protein